MEERSQGESLFLLDAMSLAFRAYFALPPELATSSGVVTNALHGFASMLVNVVRDHRPSALAVAFDLPGGTFRDALVTDYKGGRAETPDPLLAQFSMIRELVSAFAIPTLEAPGFEADDVLATLATRARDRSCRVVVVTGDRDCFQLVEDPYVRVLYNRRGVSDYSLYDETGIVERTGVTPQLYPALAALRGDPSDNLPGVPGIGEKTAAKLLGTYGDLDTIFEHLQELTPKLRENLHAHEAQVRANMSAIPLVRDVPVQVTDGDLDLGGWDRSALERVFHSYELNSLWRRLVPLLDEGCFGDPRTGPPIQRAQGEPPAPLPAAPSPDSVEIVTPDDVPGALEVLGSLKRGLGAPDGSTGAGTQTAGTETAGTETADLIVVARWDGDPGRSQLVGLAVVGARAPSRGAWIPGELVASPRVARALSETFSVGRVGGHGVKEVLRSLLVLGADVTKLVMDTEVAAYLLDPSSGTYDLASVLASVHAPANVGPGAHGSTQLALEDKPGAPEAGVLARSVVSDACAIAGAVPTLFGRLKENGLRRLHDEVEVPLVRVLARMEVVGVRVDVEELRRITAELTTECAELVERIHTLAGHDLNVNSTPQLRTLLYTELGLSPGRKTKTGYSTDAATLEGLRGEHPVVDTLLRYRELEKLRSTYGEPLLAEVGADGRIHATFRQTVARTGRISSERPNLHNIPARRESGSQFRRAFIPSEGCRFLVADYDQVELRVIAHLSGDPGLLGAFRTGSDVHREVAAGVFGVAPEEVTKEQRDRAKMVSYGLAYGMEAYGLARRLSIGVEEAKQIMDRYFAAFPKVHAYMLDTVDQARARGYTRTELGRIRPMAGLEEHNRQRREAVERQAMNAGIQGLAADLFKVALVRLDAALEDRGLGSRLVLQVHDEVVVEVVLGEEDTVEALTKDALTNAVELSVPLVLTMAWGDSWAVKG